LLPEAEEEEAKHETSLWFVGSFLLEAEEEEAKHESL